MYEYVKLPIEIEKISYKRPPSLKESIDIGITFI